MPNVRSRNPCFLSYFNFFFLSRVVFPTMPWWTIDPAPPPPPKSPYRLKKPLLAPCSCSLSSFSKTMRVYYLQPFLTAIFLLCTSFHWPSIYQSSLTDESRPSPPRKESTVSMSHFLYRIVIFYHTFYLSPLLGYSFVPKNIRKHKKYHNHVPKVD